MGLRRKEEEKKNQDIGARTHRGISELGVSFPPPFLPPQKRQDLSIHPSIHPPPRAYHPTYIIPSSLHRLSIVSRGGGGYRWCSV